MSADHVEPSRGAHDVPSGQAGEEPADQGPELQPFRIQLVNVRCVELGGSVDAAADGETGTEPEIEAGLGRTELSDNHLSFSCRLQLQMRVVAPPQKADVRITVQGDFQGLDAISQADYEAFVAYTPVALLWPYARSYTAELCRMLGVMLPPLPTLDALNVVAEPSQPGQAE